MKLQVIKTEHPVIEYPEITREYILDSVQKNYDGVLVELYKRFLNRCKKFELGRNRCVFLMGSFVIKLPWNDDGFADNDWEGSVSNDPDYHDSEIIQYARTRLAYVEDVPVVYMEHVTYVPYDHLAVIYDGNPPDWVDFVDCQQVGYTKNGRLVAFDYGYN